MRLTKILLENFRNYKKATVDIDSNLVLVLGDNASGKTNFIESIYFLSWLKSFRGPNDLLVKKPEDYFRIRASSAADTWEAFVQIAPVARRGLTFNDQKTASRYWKPFSVVLFIPQDLNLFILGPNIRRRYLDETISQINQVYAADLVSADHVLSQRSALLAEIFPGRANKSELEVWDQQLAELWLKISIERRALLAYMQSHFEQAYRQITGFENKFEFSYKGLSSQDDLNAVLNLLISHREEEIRRGMNLFGPHRDDFVLKKDGELNIYNSSRGELRSQILGIKLLQIEYLTAKDSTPIILLDDVFSELDEMRRTSLVKNLARGQVFITSTEEHHLPQMKDAQILRVENDEIR